MRVREADERGSGLCAFMATADLEHRDTQHPHPTSPAVESPSISRHRHGAMVLIEDNPVGYFKVLYLSDELISADGLSPTEVA